MRNDNPNVTTADIIPDAANQEYHISHPHRCAALTHTVA